LKNKFESVLVKKEKCSYFYLKDKMKIYKFFEKKEVFEGGGRSVHVVGRTRT